MNKTISYLVTLMGILLILPMIGVTQLGTILDGIAAWVIAIVVLIIGIGGISGKL